MFESSVRIRCPFCLERQDLLVEPDGGEQQQLIIDCEVCCHPMDISVHWDDEQQSFQAFVARGSGFD
jgi:hypothetical protein